jgi:hypothetical protein
MWRPLLPQLGCLLLPRRSSIAPWATSVSVLPRVVREAPLVASTCCVFSVAWEFHVLSYVSCALFVHNVVLPFAVPWIPLLSCHFCSLGSPPVFHVHVP